MAVNRKIRKGLATKALCFLNQKGGAPVEYLARFFHQNETSMQRVLDKLEDRKLVRMSTVMSPGNYHVTNRGYSASTHSKCAPYVASFKR
jgi:phosphatidylserine decarboxylase